MRQGPTLSVYYSPYQPRGMEWVSEVRHGWCVLNSWRPTMAEAFAIGMEDFLGRINATD